MLNFVGQVGGRQELEQEGNELRMGVAEKGFQVQLELVILTESFDWNSVSFVIRTVEENVLDSDQTVGAGRAYWAWCFCD